MEVNGAELSCSHLTGEEEGVGPAWGCSAALTMKVFPRDRGLRRLAVP